MISRVCCLEPLFTECQGKNLMRKIIVLNLHTLPMVFNCGLPQKYYCVDRRFCQIGSTSKSPLVVVKGNGPTLLGRNWLGSIRLDWGKIHYTGSTGLQNLLEKYKGVFQEKLGSFKGRQAKIEVDAHVFARPAPYPML